MKQGWLIAVLGAACTLGTGTFAGKTCSTNVDCPDPYVCAQVRPEGRTCELIRGAEIYDPNSGTGGGGGGTRKTDYCHDVKPIVDRSCVADCHGPTMTFPGTPKNFRLDVWTTGTVLPGVKDKAFNINDRISKDTMPPSNADPGTYPRPTAAERLTVSKWYSSGATECDDGGT
ncbi:MAG: hypothetical protein IPJ65_16645 [Archangiaceae bacterium]|nr:hypothetical protein [Archangiaceae bacterium]